MGVQGLCMRLDVAGSPRGAAWGRDVGDGRARAEWSGVPAGSCRGEEASLQGLGDGGAEGGEASGLPRAVALGQEAGQPVSQTWPCPVSPQPG